MKGDFDKAFGEGRRGLILYLRKDLEHAIHIWLTLGITPRVSAKRGAVSAQSLTHGIRALVVKGFPVELLLSQG